jgi:hypothetical protein
MVLVGCVQQALVARIGMHGRHQAVANSQPFVQDLRDRRETVRRARGIRDHTVCFRVVDVVEVDAKHDGHVGILGRRRDDHLPRTGLEMLLGIGSGTEAAGRLDGDVDAELLPGEQRRIAL